MQYHLPPNVMPVDAGTAGLRLLPLLERADHLIVGGRGRCGSDTWYSVGLRAGDGRSREGFSQGRNRWL